MHHVLFALKLLFILFVGFVLIAIPITISLLICGYSNLQMGISIVFSIFFFFIWASFAVENIDF